MMVRGNVPKPAPTRLSNLRGADARIAAVHARCRCKQTMSMPRIRSESEASDSSDMTSAAETKARTTPTASFSCEKAERIVVAALLAKSPASSSACTSAISSS